MINADHMVTRTKHLHPRYTNADRIRTMTDEELAEFIGSYNCPSGGEIGLQCKHDEDETTCTMCWLDWLKQEVPTDG